MLTKKEGERSWRPIRKKQAPVHQGRDGSGIGYWDQTAIDQSRSRREETGGRGAINYFPTGSRDMPPAVCVQKSAVMGS